MITINATPLVNVGDIEFGMSRAKVRELFDNKFYEFRKTKFSKNTTDDFGFLHVYYDDKNMCNAIEIFEDVEVMIQNVKVFPGSIDALKKMIPDLEEDESGYVSRQASIGVYSEEGESKTILFGTKDYYD